MKRGVVDEEEVDEERMQSGFLGSDDASVLTQRKRAERCTRQFQRELEKVSEPITATEQTQRRCSWETDKETELRQAENPPEAERLTDTDKRLVHGRLLNIVSDQCNQKRSPHQEEQVGCWRPGPEAGSRK
ncbi:unnamed protein product [Pleuronectes platessa]|uniref:Uncharacterized protein n=1 Tax=Pleuronectes platessa TaxID=8262 RepID=A0A9N7YQG5_PLEPL|nr:unnamed protein product [Pleuronectes platessa]